MATRKNPQLTTRTLARNIAALPLGRLLDFWEQLAEHGRERLLEARDLWERDHARRSDAADEDGPGLFDRENAA